MVVLCAACKAALIEPGDHQSTGRRAIGIDRSYFFFPKSLVLLANLTCEP